MASLPTGLNNMGYYRMLTYIHVHVIYLNYIMLIWINACIYHESACNIIISIGRLS